MFNRSLGLLRFGALMMTAACLAPMASYAAPVSYKVSSALSHVHFFSMQNGSPVNGEFPLKEGTVVYDPESPANCKAEVSVSLDVGGPAGAAAEIAETLLSPEWLDSKSRKTARFVSTRFARAKGGGYVLEGNLELKGVVKPVRADAEVISSDGGKFTAKAVFRLDRLQFNIGWPETDAVPSEARVEAFIVAEAVR